MTLLQQLIQNKRKFKHLMRLSKPFVEYMGNNYWFWKQKFEEAQEAIQQLRNSQKSIE